MVREKIVSRLAYYLGEINAIHPFREGNGRVQRKFIEQLAHSAGYRIDFSTISKEEMIIASARSFVKDFRPMEVLIDKCVQLPPV